MAEMAKARGWQNHSILGIVSGMLTKKMAREQLHRAVPRVRSEAGINDFGQPLPYFSALEESQLNWLP